MQQPLNKPCFDFAQQAIPLQDHERQRCEVWTRVMGYHRPVSSFNLGKQGEHAERTPFVEPRPGDRRRSACYS
ncbi:MAG: anaerobic ribonucleoside-triphosphate reductase [Thiothrix sp.]